MMSRTRFAAGLVTFALLIGGVSGSAAAEDLSAVEDVILLLQERGVIEEADATRIVETNRAYETRETWADRITFFGDMRARYENFWYDEDPTGEEARNRTRLRYRLRIGARTKINDHFDFAFRLASGSSVRSRNQTLGGSGFDFFPDDFNIDQAYITYHPFVEGAIPLDGRKLDVMFGKMPNPFRSKVGKDYLIWDGDITPEGIALSYEIEPVQDVSVAVNLAYFVDDENRSAEDPAVIPVQLGLKAGLTDDVSVGARLGYHAWRNLRGRDEVLAASDFFARGEFFGNIPGGLSDGDSVDIGDVYFWVKWTGLEKWPVLVYGGFAKNFSTEAVSLYNAGREDLAWSVGLEIGDKKEFVWLGAGYFWIEANAAPGQIMESDLFDAHTNRKGWEIYGAREIYSHTDLKLTLRLSEALNDDITWEPAVRNSDRIRLQTDVIVKF
jgi:hypothetical protein